MSREQKLAQEFGLTLSEAEALFALGYTNPKLLLAADPEDLPSPIRAKLTAWLEPEQ